MLAEQLSTLIGQPINPNRVENAIHCPLPDHEDTHRSASINIGNGVWNCLGCGRGGTLTTLAAMLGGQIDEADLWVATVKDEPVDEIPVDFSDQLDGWREILPTTPEALAYGKSKGLYFSTLQFFGVRHDGLGNLVFPYFDGQRVAAIKYRARDGRKWAESGSQRVIYNVNEVRGSNVVILAEGESDTQAIWQAMSGMVAVGGVSGASSSIAWWESAALDLMWAEEIYLAFDNDEAGEAGCEKAASVLNGRAKRLAPPQGYNDWAEATADGIMPTLEGGNYAGRS